MSEKIKEFIDDTGSIISGSVPPNIDATATSHMTTDKYMHNVAQSTTQGNYRRFYGESDLQYNKEADLSKDNPEKFYKFLASKGLKDEFTKYFNKVTPQDKIKEASKSKAFKIIEDIMNRSSIVQHDIFTKEGEPRTIDEIKTEDSLIFDKLDKLCDYIRENIKPEDKKVIIAYFNKRIYHDDNNNQLNEGLKDWIAAGLITLGSITSVSALNTGSGSGAKSAAPELTVTANKEIANRTLDSMSDDEILILYTQLQNRGYKNIIKLNQSDMLKLTTGNNLKNYMVAIMKDFIIKNPTLFRKLGTKLVLK